MEAEGEDVRFGHDGNKGGSPATSASEALREFNTILHAIMARQVSRSGARDDEAGHYSDRGADALKVAKVLFVYCILFGVETRKSSVDRWVWTLVEEIDAWEAFPWGKYTYQMLMHYIEILPISTAEGRDSMSYHFYGFAMSLLIWAYEVITSLRKECVLLVRVDERPRCLWWEFPKRTKSYFDFFDKPYVAPQKSINLRSSTVTLTQRGLDRGQKSKRSTTSMVGVSKRQKTVSASAGDRGCSDADSKHQYVVHIEGTSHGLSRDSVDDSDTVHLDEGQMDSPQDIGVGRSEHTDDCHHGIGEEPIQEDQCTEAGDSVPTPDHDSLVGHLYEWRWTVLFTIYEWRSIVLFAIYDRRSITHIVILRDAFLESFTPSSVIFLEHRTQACIHRLDIG
ncbi:hypothetical protein PTKIN_Ptkin10aG0050000 [Pterospermum kingtungense]